MRGRFHEMVAPWDPAAERPPDLRLEARPSLWSALDVPFKAFLTLTAFIIPIGITGGLIAQDPLAGLTIIQILELVQILPAFLLAFAPAVRIIFTRYWIDDDGIRVTSQVLARSESRVTWEKVTAIRQRITLLDRLFRIERIDIIAYGERGTTLHLVGLRDAKRLRDVAARRMRENASLGALLASD